MAAPGRLSRFEWACVAVIGVAFLFRVDYVLHPDVIWDSAWYMMLARSFSEDGTFWIRWTDPPVTNSYWPPLFPIVLSLLVRLLGASYHVLALGSVMASALLTTAVFFTTREMMGRTRAFAAAALIAASPAFTSSDQRGMAESLLALTVVLTLWALLRAVEKPRWLPAAFGLGLLTYLAKANLGIPFVLAGLVALGLWIGWARGWRRTFGNPIYVLTGLAAVGVLAAFALLRTGKVGGIGVGIIEPVTRAISHPLWVPFFLFKLLFAASFLVVVTLPFSLHVKKALPALDPRRDPKAGTLWLATILPLLATAIFTASFLITEQRGPTQFGFVVDAFGESFLDGFIELTAAIGLLVDFDNVRYLTPSIVPFLWLVLPHYPLESDPAAPLAAEGSRVRRAQSQTFALAAGAYVLLLLLNPIAGTKSFSIEAQLDRLFLLLLLSLVPLGVALLARSQWWTLNSRTTAKGDTVWRYVPSRPPPPRRGAVVGILVAALLFAYLASAWFGMVAIGLLIALAARTRGAAAVTMALVLLATTAPTLHTPLPTEELNAWMRDNLAPGTIVATPEPVVYIAATAPDNVRIREVDFSRGISDDHDLILLTGSAGTTPPENFTLVKTWDYRYEFSPTLEARLAIERNLLGKNLSVRPLPGLTLHVRDGSEVAQTLLG